MNKNKHNRKVSMAGGFSLSLLLVCCTFTLGWGQSTSASQESDILVSHASQEAPVSAINQLISISFKDAALLDALKQVTDDVGMELSYSKEVLPINKKVTADFTDTPVNEVMYFLLEGTQLRYAISEKGSLVLFEYLEEQQQSSSLKHSLETVSGLVTDAESGESLPGVNIAIKGTSRGTSTDSEGRYELEVPALQDTLIFSFIGYQTATVPINGRTTINLELQQQAISGEEIVVVGYGEQTRESLTGSISTVGSEEIMKSPAINVGNSLAGKATGLHITQASGLPGEDTPRIYLRGIGSLTEWRSQPLYIIDGVKRDMFQLDPSNIESISVLKDATATAIYGIEGANGVIVVKTKRGKEGPVQISAKFSTGLQQPTNLPEFVGSYRYAKLFNEAQIRDGVSPNNVRFSDEAIEAFRTQSHPLIYPDMDWVEYITKPTAFQTKNNISISGGTNDVKYFLSGGYLKQDGLFKTFNSTFDFNPSFTKYNYRANLDIDATPTTKISMTSFGRMETRVREKTENNRNRWINVYRGAPFSGAGVVDGKIITNVPNHEYISCCKLDPLSQFFAKGVNYFDKNVLNIDLSIQQKLNFVTQGLTFKVKGSYNSIYQQNKYKTTAYTRYIPYFKTDLDPDAPGDSTVVFKKRGDTGPLSYSKNYNRDQNWYIEARLDYKRDFGPHKVGGLILFNQRKDFYPNTFRGIPRGLVGLVGRVNYSYDDRYFLETNMGYNGSENFAKGRRFGFFPSVSGGWIISNESFMDNVPLLDYLKLRASYGIVGNDQGVGRFLYLPNKYNTSAFGYNFGYEIPQDKPGVAEDQIGNPNVHWETAEKQNYGIDLRFLNNRLSLNLDYFREYRTNILTTLNTVPTYVAADLPAVNIGEVKNYGYEAEIKWQQQAGSDFFYHIGANVSFARNKIVEMDEITRQEPYLQRTGHPVGQKFGYVFDGFFAEEDFNSNSGVPEHPYQAKPGDLKFKDLNGDGVVNSSDQRAVGYPPNPEYSFGATIGFNYKNIDLTTIWAGAAHVSRMLANEPYRTAFGPGGAGYYSLLKWQADGAWTPEKGQDATYPRLSTTIGGRRNTMTSDFWSKDASYLRLKNVEVGYNLSPNLLQNIGLKKMRIYASGYNLLTFSKLDKYTLDPEQNTFPGGTRYPITKIYNFGVKLDF